MLEAQITISRALSNRSLGAGGGGLKVNKREELQESTAQDFTGFRPCLSVFACCWVFGSGQCLCCEGGLGC